MRRQMRSYSSPMLQPSHVSVRGWVGEWVSVCARVCIYLSIYLSIYCTGYTVYCALQVRVVTYRYLVYSLLCSRVALRYVGFWVVLCYCFGLCWTWIYRHRMTGKGMWNGVVIEVWFGIDHSVFTELYGFEWIFELAVVFSLQLPVHAS